MSDAPLCPTLDELFDPAFFRALADPNRIAILCGLAGCCGESRCVGEVAEEMEVDLSGVSRHLRTLREAGVLTAERHGKEVRYTVRYDELVRRLRSFADAIESCCPGGTAARSCNCQPGGAETAAAPTEGDAR